MNGCGSEKVTIKLIDHLLLYVCSSFLVLVQNQIANAYLPSLALQFLLRNAYFSVTYTNPKLLIILNISLLINEALDHLPK